MASTIPSEILDDLCSRFILNVPDEGKKDNNRILFNVELAHWFYLDFYCVENKNYPTCTLHEFARQVFNHLPSFKEQSMNFNEIYAEWKEYKLSVPTFGAIILDESNESVLLVQGCWANASWGFPKGKVNEEEKPVDCAVREVYEETGFDISKLIDENISIKNNLHDQLNQLYVITGVSKKTEFKPKTRNEIKNLKWFKVADLPAHRKDLTPKVNLGMNNNSFFTVIPFVKQIRKWIGNFTANKSGRTSRTRSKTIGDASAVTKDEETAESRTRRQQQQFKKLTEQSLASYLTINKDDRSHNVDGVNSLQQQSQAEHQSSRQRRDKERRSSRTQYSPPPRMQKLKQRQQTQQQNKLYGIEQILSREHKMPENSSHVKRNLLTGFDDNPHNIGITLCNSWKNFKFNKKEIYACFAEISAK